MDSVHPALRQDYNRQCAALGDDIFGGPNTVGYQKVLKAHYLLADYFAEEREQILFGVKSTDLLMSAMGRQFVSYGSSTKWQTDLELCATLFFGLIKNHAFVDGNKRTAFLILILHLLKIGRTPSSSHKDFEDLAVATAANKLNEYKQFSKFEGDEDGEVKFIDYFLRRNTRLIDKKHYMITFQQLDTILRRHGFYLDDPDKNFINVYKRDEPQKFFGITVRNRRNVRVAQVGFKGWKHQVKQEILKEVRRRAGLTTENGIDSVVFFRDADPLTALIGQYHGPLQRLRDK